MVETLPSATIHRMRHYRKNRLLQMMQELDVPTLLIYDPVNIRYATDSRNVQVYALNHDCRYLFMAADGTTELFDWVAGHDAYHGHLDTIDMVHTARPVGYMSDGEENFDNALALWADEITALVRRTSPDDLRIGIDRLTPFQATALEARGVSVINGQAPIYRARAVKGPEEVEAQRLSAKACHDGFQRMFAVTQPGVTESDIWAHLHAANIEWEGEWINARYLLSGEKTNPWAQETGLRIIRPGDLIGCDSDLIGPYGYAHDISRTWIADGKPDDRQRRLYAASFEHVHRNMELLKPGVTFMELTEKGFTYSPELAEQNFTTIFHGLGLENEWPIIKSPDKRDIPGAYGGGYDGVIEAGMTLCIESYAGEVGGPDGVKLEEMVLITADGWEQLSTYPLD
ncbi:MAG: aminopeptidase P family protein, partial [Acidimicrobiales bacterium]|nr:aminopeptidase P family protein [Acidimicrobiales bacterium]